METKTAPYIPENAPFSPEQRAWLNGFLAGTFSTQAVGTHSPETTPKPSVTILYGSQTGNAESLSKTIRKALTPSCASVECLDMSDFEISKLSELSHLIIVTSTYGEGDPPDNARDFYEAIHKEDSLKLDNLSYAVFALGDSSYPDFCQTGKDFDTRLESLGAQRILPRVDADVDFDDTYETWITSLSSQLGSIVISQNETVEETSPRFSKKKTYLSPLKSNLKLNGPDSAKDTRHFEFKIDDPHFHYEAGDALGVSPKNPPVLVDAIIGATTLERTPQLVDALTNTFDITKLTLDFISFAANHSDSDELKSLATTFAQDRKAFNEYVWGRDILDILENYPCAFTSTEAFLSGLKPLSPRLYSISSSPKKHPGEVHLTVGVVHYASHGRQRGGICSNYLADQPLDSSIPVFIQPNKHFKVPTDPTTPMIMIGPGTGIAPFRAFLEEREATGATGPNWLFFGDQHAASDFLYKETLEHWVDSKLLTRLDTAFSRDQEAKVYVQTKMLEAAETLVSWLDDGAYLFVCGDASRMAKDVDQALRKAIQQVHACSQEDVNRYVDQLNKSKRYLRDVY